MQVNTYANVASITHAVSNKKANNVESSTQTMNLQSANLKDEETLNKLNSLGGKGLSQLYFMEFAQQSMNAIFGNTNAQAGVSNLLGGTAESILSKIDFAGLGYMGKSPLAMNQDELKELVGENGFFGVANTANRIADFVIQGAGDDPQKLQKGFEGMKKGFEEAQNLWGGKLPQISQDTINQALEKVSKRIDELGGQTLNLEA
ncbi:hypothetical protein Q9Q51_08570 [Campylobacter upsaliensis]|uniref:Hydrogenase-4 component G n=1 Tax=Campylobacter upsaliensis TaxID=28080 RepID=A0A5M0KG03_CAMUP|nr:hypothetical protein [Campylobacter upsaliensis]EAB5282392.1 hypothetical protein [Campylobacter upsaliensis]EAH5552677.1 hypothetical protein [Campylobacter upsaliensis]EAH5675882.1 hypothetical protein [Campylobacter upsaliensis]EAH5977893.1 hypothetical protein [Campylobacter upsaliensis]EAH5982042.1 hypothetical protein [Campylobacter upsaliensis]